MLSKPRNSLGSSKTLILERKFYQIKKECINNLFSTLKADTQVHHSKYLEKQASILSTVLKDMDLKHVNHYLIWNLTSSQSLVKLRIKSMTGVMLQS